MLVGNDTVTEGAWMGVYGSDGYNIINDQVSYPEYVTVTPSSDYSNWTWAASSTDAWALQTVENPSVGIEACWYSTLSTLSFTVDLVFSQPARFTVYILDGDRGWRKESLTLADENENVLSTYTSNYFDTGQYLSWDVSSGHFVLTITSLNSNAVLSGIFFDPVPSTQTTQTQTGVSHINAGNTTTQKSQSGVSRIQVGSNQKSQTGISRIYVIGTQRSQTGVAHIVTGTTQRSQNSIANVRSTTQRTQSCGAYILHQGTTLRLQSSVARLQITTQKSQAAISRFQATKGKNQLGVCNLRSTTTQTINGTVRVFNPANKDQIQYGTARIFVTQTDRWIDVPYDNRTNHVSIESRVFHVHK
jgi:hypothetical protein